MPFGGVKDPGHGQFGDRAGIDPFMELRWTTVQTADRHYPFRQHEDRTMKFLSTIVMLAFGLGAGTQAQRSGSSPASHPAARPTSWCGSSRRRFKRRASQCWSRTRPVQVATWVLRQWPRSQPTGRGPVIDRVNAEVKAPGYETLITHVFRSDGPYLDSDAVFGARQSLIADWKPQPDGSYLVECDFVLNPVHGS